MTWLLMATGRQHHLSGHRDTQDNVPGIREIAHSLAQINRFTGHCSRPYSVAEHSLLVLGIARTLTNDTDVLLAALMHDAHECITGDVASPVKQKLGSVWSEFEDWQRDLLLEHYGLLDASFDNCDLIKRCDLIALATERRDLMPFTALHDPWPILDTPGQRIGPSLNHALNIESRAAVSWKTWAFMYETEATQLMELRLLEAAT